MIYCCGKCRFVFERKGIVDACPDCGKLAVREATKKEKAEYKINREEIKKSQKQHKE